jgi:hypothetical protein
VPDFPSLIESASGGDEQKRQFFTAVVDQLTMLGAATGNNTVQPLSGAQAPASSPPTVGSLSVSGANGTYTIAVSNASQGGVNATIYNEVSYSPIQSFGQSVTVLPVSPGTHFTVPSPGQQLFFRLRQSFDQNTWSNYTTGTTAVASNLQSSAASENATVLNQSNYAYVDSVTAGATANVRVYGAAGPYNGYVKNKGATESARPSATIVNVTHGSTQIVTYNGSEFELGANLPQAFADSSEPVGQVSVVGTGTPTLPTVTPILQAGHLIGATFTAGAGLTQPPTLTVSDSGGGTGAVIIAIIAGGAMTGYDIQAAGENYTGATIITASGGVFSGATGGGTATGGNGGRLTKI